MWLVYSELLLHMQTTVLGGLVSTKLGRVCLWGLSSCGCGFMCKMYRQPFHRGRGGKTTFSRAIYFKDTLLLITVFSNRLNSVQAGRASIPAGKTEVSGGYGDGGGDIKRL